MQKNKRRHVQNLKKKNNLINFDGFDLMTKKGSSLMALRMGLGSM